MKVIVETAEYAGKRRECKNVISAHLCELCGEKNDLKEPQSTQRNAEGVKFENYKF